ncbi:MAG: hypothetical protein U0625_09280 [Phycisphaerales bacterium]
MHIALVIDPERLLTDAAAFHRLAVALAAEGARVTRILPESSEEPPMARLLAAHPYHFDGSALFRRARLGTLSADLEDAPPEVFVSFGARAFDAAAALAEDLEAGLVAIVATADELQRTPLRRRLAQLDLVGASTAPLAVRAARIVAPELVTVLPLGVQVPDHGRAEPASPASIAIAGSARDDGAYRAVFAAIADIAPALPNLQVAIEFPPGHDPRLWGLAREAGIQPVLNGVTRLESIRPLALACGVFMVPEVVHGTRPLLLEAMAAGRIVLAADDADADFLIDGVTALLPRARDARSWTEALTRAMQRPEVAELGREASARVAARYASGRCALQLLDACELIVRGPAIPFPGVGSPGTAP